MRWGPQAPESPTSVVSERISEEIGQTIMSEPASLGRRLLLMLSLLQIGCVIQRALTRDEVMREIGPRFPLEARRSLFYARLQNPDVRFAGDQLEIHLEAEAGAPGL